MRALLTKQLHVSVGSRVWEPKVGILLLGLFGILLFCRLGVWQLDRAVLKEQMTARYAERLHAAPLALPQLLAKGSDIEDFPVHLTGHYDNSRLVYLDNQPLLLLGASLTAILALVLDGIVAAGSRHWLARHGGTA